LISYDFSGKPFIRNSEKYISFSHSGEYVVLIVSLSHCGIDIEKDNPKIELISPKFLNESEKCFLYQPGAINWIWSIKEAIFKYFGSRVFFKNDITIDHLNTNELTSRAIYTGILGTGIFELELIKLGNYYLAYTKAYQPT
jgi:phosphopantetheinyl transferase